MTKPAEKMRASSKQLLLQIVLENQVVKNVLDSAGGLKLPNWYVGAGCIAQTVWNKYHEYDLTKDITDIDLVYFDDNDLSYEAEDKIINAAKLKFSGIPISIDVKNQARVHLWYNKHFNYDIAPYSSIEDAICVYSPPISFTISFKKSISFYT